MTEEQMRQLIALILGKKGGSDFSSMLSDPFLAFLSGSYQPEPVESEGDIYARTAPTLMAIQQQEPEGSWRKVAAGQIASGVPAYKVKESILVLASENPDALGLVTSKEASDFVDELARENQAAQNALTQQAQRKDPFQKAGFRGAQETFSLDEIVNRNPEVFRELMTRGETDSVKRIREKMREDLAKVTYREEDLNEGTRRQQGGLRSFLYGGSPTDMMSVPITSTYFDPKTDMAENIGQALQIAGDRGGKSFLGGLIREKPISQLRGLVEGLLDIPATVAQDVISPGKRQREREQRFGAIDASGARRMVVDKDAAERRRQAASEQEFLLPFRKGSKQFNEEVAQLVAQKLQQKTAESGASPLTEQLLNAALLARSTRR
jgi:hypothetical protein